MSIKVMSRVWEACPYEGKKLLVLLALCDFSDDDGNCWPNMEQIAKKARCNLDYARSCVREFEKDGWVITQENRGKGHRNYYTIQNQGSSRVLVNQGSSVTKPGVQRKSVSNSKTVKEPSTRDDEIDQDQAPATGVEEDGAAPTVSNDSLHDSTGQRNGNQENHVEPVPKQDYTGLPKQEIRRRMRAGNAFDREIAAVCDAPVPWEAFAVWDQTRELPGKERRVPATNQPKRSTLWDVL